jgi:hypothetical protein
MPRKNEQEASRMLKLKSRETKLKTLIGGSRFIEMENCLYLILTVADGLLHYEFNYISGPRSEKLSPLH